MYDLVVIGGGSGGVRAARMAASYGAKVAIVEEYRYGGTCVIRGCVPKKHYVNASRFTDLFELAPSFGWDVTASFDFATLKANKDREIARLEGIYGTMLDRAGVEVIKDRATVAGPNSVHLVRANRDLETRFILVATGGHPFVPHVPGSELGIDSNGAFELQTLPASILIEGAGYIAVEFAGIFAGLGVETTLVYRRDNVLRGFDEDLRTDLRDAMQARGVRFLFHASIERLEKVETGLRATFTTGYAETFGAVMFATGRIANTRNMGLEEVGVRMDEWGTIAVDAYSQTSVPSIYAVGDVTGRAELTPVAIREGAAFAETVFNNNLTSVDHGLIPTAVFSEPEIGTIGLSEEDAVKKHGDVDVWVTRFRPMINTLSDRPGKVMFKLITEKDAGKVLGVHLLGASSAEMIQLVAIPMAMGATKADFDRAIAVHPTAAEELVTLKAPSYFYRGGVKQ